jgi:hypothetical protein
MHVAHPKLNGITLGDGPLLPLAIECKELQSKLYQQAYILFQLLKAWDDEEDTDSKVRQAYKIRQWAEHSFAAFCARYELMPEGEVKSLLLEIAYSAEKQHL